MVGYAVLIVVTIAIFFFVLQPLIMGRGQGPAVVPARLADLQARRAYLMDAIRDVDFDHALGKVSEAEYQEARGRYVREAAKVLRDLERESQAVDAQIDDEIARLRELARKPASQPPGEASTPS